MLAMIVFLVMQAGAGVVVYGIAVALKPELLKEFSRTGDQSVLEIAISPTALALAVVISGLLSIGVIALLKTQRPSTGKPAFWLSSELFSASLCSTSLRR